MTLFKMQRIASDSGVTITELRQLVNNIQRGQREAARAKEMVKLICVRDRMNRGLQFLDLIKKAI